MFTDKGIDTGDMLLRSAVDILPGETCGELTARLSKLGAQVLTDTLNALEAGALTRVPQDESAMTYDPMLTKEMGFIDWSASAADIVNRIHGLNPWPGAVVVAPEGTIKLWRAEVVSGSGQPGRGACRLPEGGPCPRRPERMPFAFCNYRLPAESRCPPPITSAAIPRR